MIGHYRGATLLQQPGGDVQWEIEGGRWIGVAEDIEAAKRQVDHTVTYAAPELIIGLDSKATLDNILGRTTDSTGMGEG